VGQRPSSLFVQGEPRFTTTTRTMSSSGSLLTPEEEHAQSQALALSNNNENRLPEMGTIPDIPVTTDNINDIQVPLALGFDGGGSSTISVAPIDYHDANTTSTVGLMESSQDLGAALPPTSPTLGAGLLGDVDMDVDPIEAPPPTAPASLKRPNPATMTTPAGKKQKVGGPGSGSSLSKQPQKGRRRGSTGSAPTPGSTKMGGGINSATKSKHGTYSHNTHHHSMSSTANDAWNAMLFELLKFRARKGHCNVPKTGALGRWVARQRLLRPKSSNDVVEHAEDYNNETGPAVDGENSAVDTNNINIDASKNDTSSLSAAATTTDIPSKEDPTTAMTDLSPTATTTTTADGAAADPQEVKAEPQSAAAIVGSSDGARHFLTPDKVEVLESIGFVWDPVQADYDDKWKRRFDELCNFVRANGHFSVSQSTGKCGEEERSETTAPLWRCAAVKTTLILTLPFWVIFCFIFFLQPWGSGSRSNEKTKRKRISKRPA
jgi:hypothetical protein